jgi:pimeloyl-ACP methyl ester carboxylesterase/class 3 adenylate cyclase
MVPRTRYAKSGELSIAYNSLGNGPIDIVYAQGWVSHLEYAWESPDYARFLSRIADFSRLICFDRRGTGLSDRHGPPATLEERVEDISAVMDAVGSRQAALFGVSEGGHMALMFAATHPERTRALVLAGCYARESWAAEYPWGKSDAARAAWQAKLDEMWGGPFALEAAAPSVANDPAACAWFGAYLRYAASPGAAKAIDDLNWQVDMRDILPSVGVPTLILHRQGDRWYSLEEARYLAHHIPDARLVVLPGDDHIPWWGDQQRLIGEIQEFLTGDRDSPPTERVLLTILITDIVGSTEHAARLGDRLWKDRLEAHDALVRQQVKKFAGQEINTTGDGFVLAFTGPTRAIHCARAMMRDLDHLGLTLRAGLHTGECERRGDDLSGLALHIAARIASKALPGTIMMSRTVKDLIVGSGVSLKDQGTHVLKGMPGEWSLYAVTD